MFRRVATGIAVTLGAVLLYAATRPDTVLISRSPLIRATPETIFGLIHDFHQWVKGAPQDREDPAMVRTYGGAASGVGAVSAWESGGSAGTGRMAITESLANSKIAVTVDFRETFEGSQCESVLA